MKQPTTDTFKHLNTSRIEKEGWMLFGEQKFPNYALFWQDFVMPRSKPGKFAPLPGTPDEERRIIKLAHRIFSSFDGIYDYKPYKGTKIEWHEKGRFRVWLSSLNHICDNFEFLLFVLLVVTHELDEQDPAYKGYIKRIADRQARVEAERAANSGRLFSLESIPKPEPPVAILPNELKVVKEKFDLRAYEPLTEHIRSYEAAIDALSSFDRKNWRPSHEGHKLEDYSKPADNAALEKLLNGQTMRELVLDQTDDLIAIINQIFGEQLLPLIQRHNEARPKADAETPTTKITLLDSTDWQKLPDRMSKDAIKKLIEKAAQEVRELLPDLSPHINIIVKPGLPHVTEDMGVGGSTYDPELLDITFDPFLPKGLVKTRVYLRDTIYHEMSHALRYKLFPQTDDYMYWYILEGLAVAFERDYAGANQSWKKYESDEIMFKWLQEVMADDNPNAEKWFKNHPDGRRLIAYKLGLWLVDRAKARSLLNTIQLLRKDTDEIVRLAEAD